MFVATMLDAFPCLSAPLESMLRELAAPVRFKTEIGTRTDHSLLGTFFAVTADDASAPHQSPRSDRLCAHNESPGRHDHTHPNAQPHADGHRAHHVRGAHGHASAHTKARRSDGYRRHGHTPHSSIVAWLNGSPLDDLTRTHALGIFHALAEAEGAVHGIAPEEVEFHEVGAWDSIADIVSAAFLIGAIGARTWSVAPLPIGGGLVLSAHGVLPIPAPATAWLTRGMAMRNDGVPGERVTPTGAAVLHYLRAGHTPVALATEVMTLVSSGFGLGTRRLPDRANALRCLAFQKAPMQSCPSPDVEVDCIAFDVDDQSPEDLAVGLNHLRGEPGVLQVTQQAAFGKKGRMVAKIEIVASVDRTDAVVEKCFAETTTIGLRISRARRRVLPRTIVAPSRGGLVSAKIVRRNATSSAKAEMDEIAANAVGYEQRQDLRRASEAAALSHIGEIDEHR